MIMRLPAVIIAAALCALFAAGCAAGGGFECPGGMDPFIELNVYFGQERGDGGMVSEEEWQTFLADTVTPRFPDGLTVVDAHGQWFDTDEGRLYQEAAKMLNVLVPAGTADTGVAAIREISDTYKARFEQQAVFHTALPACAAVY